jgi:type VI secretion system protein VasJ
VDWQAVVDSAGEILCHRSKDFRVGAYMVVGLFHQEGYQGLLQGLELYQSLAEEYWESGFPVVAQRRARANAVLWLADKTALHIGRQPPQDASVAAACLEAAESLRQTIEPHAPEQAAGLTGLVRAFERWRSQPAAAEPPPPRPEPDEDRPAEETPGPAPAPPRPAPESPGETSADRQTRLNEIADQLQDLAQGMRWSDLRDPQAFRLSRAAAWLTVNSPPEHSDGITIVPGPGEIETARFEALVAEKNWPNLLEEAEFRFSRSIFWLDLQRYVHQALSNLGPDFQECGRTVIRETAAFLDRMPGLLDLKFSDGQPLADGRTKAWLRSAPGSLPPGTASPSAGLEPGPGGTDRSGDWPEKAGAALAQGRLEVAVRLFSEARLRADGPRERFLTQHRFAELCLEAGQRSLARAQFLALWDQIERRSLDQWEPRLCLSVIRTFYRLEQERFRDSGQPGPADNARLDALLGRLSDLDASAVLELEGT